MHPAAWWSWVKIPNCRLGDSSERLAREALLSGVLDAVSGERLWRDLRPLLADGRTSSENCGRLEQLGFLASEIPYASEVERMGLQRRPLLDYSSTSAASQAYEALWDEAWLRLGAGEGDGRALRKSTRKKLERAISDPLEAED